ncbi:unnamed protein product [Cyclocybe aegerita]|uniref:Uncharacterized protein n=1 Tax=Cyclocybe aegerita TaxID=1973307 RepID=A0A8S0WDK2_CYCAE|nr:unnamed protein product [Cyclocybe aegerita]
MSSQPAHLTKHVPLLSYPLPAAVLSLSQLTDGVSNGTALWLGGQCLAIYLSQMHKKFSTPTSRRAIELGSGIGLTALALSSLGWDVLATDIPHVIDSVLAKNITNNLSVLPPGSGIVQVRQLDWSVAPSDWTWDHESTIASHSLLPPSMASPSDLIRPPFDLIISADTVYAADLVDPMLRTLHALSTLSASTAHCPTVLLCIERRDPLLVDRLLSDAKDKWNFAVERVQHRKLVKAVEKSGAGWTKSDWDGVELWKLKLRVS